MIRYLNRILERQRTKVQQDTITTILAKNANISMQIIPSLKLDQQQKVRSQKIQDTKSLREQIPLVATNKQCPLKGYTPSKKSEFLACISPNHYSYKPRQKGITPKTLTNV